MTIPVFLDSSQVPFNYLEHYGLTDVETGGVGLITDTRAQLVTGLGWTEPSTALFKTPLGAPYNVANNWMDILMTRISATVMEWRVRNAAGTTICTRRATLVSGGIVRYHFNIFGAYIECVQTDPSAAETLQAYILDQTPDLQTDSTNYVVGGGRRNNAGTDDATGNICGHLYALDNGAAAHVAGRTPGPRQAGTTAMNYTNAQVSWLFRDAMIFINQAGSLKWTGRIYHALLCDATIPPQAERSINIDTATTGVFKVTGQPLIQTTQKIMMRKS